MTPCAYVALWAKWSLALVAVAAAPGCTLPCPGVDVQVCDAGLCATACRPPCRDAGECEAGQACVVAGGEGYCSWCQSELCADRTECLSAEGACEAVECGRRTPCLEPTDVCDLAVNRCYPGNGRCQSTADCPAFGMRKAGVAACEGGFCVLQAFPLSPVVGLAGPEEVSFLRPTPAERFDSPGDVVFRWSGAPHAAVVEVLRDYPLSAQDVATAVIWGASVPGSATPQLHLADGRTVDGGSWGPVATSLPADVPLYALVQLVDGPRLMAASPPVPFTIGRGWRAIGDPCDDVGTVPGSCSTPARPQACVLGTCRRLCLSNLDCLDLDRVCSPPKDGLRYCH